MGGYWRGVGSPEEVDKRLQIWTPAAREPGRTLWQLHADVEWRYAPNLPGENVTALLTRYGPALQPAAEAVPGETVLEAAEPSDYEIRLEALRASALFHSTRTADTMAEGVIGTARVFAGYLAEDGA
jgi:hypothetical protein